MSATISSKRLRLVDVGLRVFDLLGRRNRRFDDRRRVAFVRALQGDRDNRAGLEVDGMLGFVGQMRPAILHLRDLRIGIGGFVQSLFDVFFLRFRSSRAKSSRVGVSIPDAFARPVRNA